MRTLYLHIGTPKTATTTIQCFLAANRGALNACGYDVPVTPSSETTYEREHNAGFLLHAGLPGRDSADEVSEGLAGVVRSLERFDAVVLSHENLWPALAHGNTAFLPLLAEHSREHGYALKVIVYLRRPDELAVSWRNQDVKNGIESTYRTMTWEKWLVAQGDCIFDYHSGLEYIASHIGRENIIVRVWERASREGRRPHRRLLRVHRHTTRRKP